jgi:hypothetical protein
MTATEPATGAGVHADEVVVNLEQIHDALVVRFEQRVRDPRVVVGGDHLEAGGRLRRERPDVRVARDVLALGEQMGDRVVVSRRTR